MKRLVVLSALLLAFGAVPAAEAHHSLSRSEAAREFKRHVFNTYSDVDYFDTQPSCYRFSRYLFRCVGLVIYFDGMADCIRGPVRAVGARRHQVSVRVFIC
jgi:hypothetical protein